MKVFAVVATYNRPDTARLAIDALLDQSRMIDEIVIVENSDEPYFENQYPADRVEVFRPGRNTGAAGGFGIGADIALERGASHVMLVDDDCILGATAFERLSSHVEQFPNDALGPRVTDEADPEPPVRRRSGARSAAYVAALASGEPTEVPLLGAFHGLLISAETLNRTGGPRKDLFFGGPDVEFCLRLQSHGVKLILCPDARATHHAPYYHQFWLFGKRRVRSGTPGRGYYVLRNRLIMWRLYRRDSFLAGVGQTFGRELLGALLSSRRLRRIRLLFRGLRDGLFGDPQRELRNDVPLYE